MKARKTTALCQIANRIESRRYTWAQLIALLLLAVGCGQPSGNVSEALFENVLISEAPSDISSLAECYQKYQPGQKVVVAGRIFADSMSPFSPDTASFSLIELPKPGHDHENPGDCPFCKREMENAATAIIELVGDDGQVIPGSAEQLFELRKNQDVVVVGEANMVGDVMVIKGVGLHLLSEALAAELAKQFSS